MDLNLFENYYFIVVKPIVIGKFLNIILIVFDTYVLFTIGYRQNILFLNC